MLGKMLNGLHVYPHLKLFNNLMWQILLFSFYNCGNSHRRLSDSPRITQPSHGRVRIWIQVYMSLNPTLLTTEHCCLPTYIISTLLSTWRPCWAHLKFKKCEPFQLLFPIHPVYIVGKWFSASLVKPRLPISLPMAPCPSMITGGWGKRRYWNSYLYSGQFQELVQKKGYGLEEFWWEAASHLKNVPKQVTTHWEN